MRKLLAIITVLASLTTAAQANNAVTNDDLTAGKLYTSCVQLDAVGSDDGLCNMYFRGLTDALFVMAQMNLSHRPTCMPENTAIDVAEARRIFNRYMATHSGAAQHSAGLMAAFAIFEAYPCK
jgi:hypothetical protein